MYKVLFLIVSVWLIVSCDSSTPEFYYTKGKLKYQYHDIVEDGKVPAIGDYLSVYIDYKTADGKLIYSSIGSTYNNKQVIHLGKPTIEGGIEEGFAQLMEGDSVTFYISAEKFFSNYLSTSLPKGIDKEEEILITLRLIKIESPYEHEIRMEEEAAICELSEFHLIDSIVDTWELKGEPVESINGIYIVKGNEISEDTIKYGNIVNISYKGYYPNGKEFYNNLETNPDEFKVGVEGQTIEGLKIAMLNMNYGQSAKIIIPSYLGFSAEAINSGQVPSCTPLIFELKILNKNK